ncbi:MAG: H-NS family nucleoid-associated regulatory protein [Pseudomonadota bacterium]|jgi:DNA-binding protein H-NS|uniref:DNA-binding protein H-NS-like C-terminal domain-containing protein n=2 Tax=Ralstonia pickettii TaxID=329 RepID=R0CM96_RALPI|nr:MULTISPECIES: H-NS family nucleoid-associated regulatory protein [Ralstonia]ENZ77786.1 hypothetical protein OR214_02062 [Ralstonia pickettii OR214]MBL4779362.1 H-NS histone family protein [Ralstonia sp.]MCM3582111.1 H-NS histone family protein [Ralstonia pickettii]
MEFWSDVLNESLLSAAELRQRAEAILWVRTQIAVYGLTYAELKAAGCFQVAPPRERPVRYRNAQGQAWDGQGKMPDWLQRAVHAGQSVDFFRVGT